MAVALLASSACGGRSALGVAGLEESPPVDASGAGGTLTAAAGRASVGGAGQGGQGGQGGQATTGGTAGETGLRPRVASAISAGTDATCAVVTDGSVWCWGANELGQLGDGTTTYSDVPVRVTGISEAVAVTAGGTWHWGGQGATRSAYACAVLRDGTVQCWGSLRSILGAAGVGTSAVPVLVPGVAHALAIAGGDSHVCVLLEGGSVECWGVNGQGELGNGLTPLCSLCASDPAPVAVSTLSGATDVAGKGSQFTCSALADGSVHCWGALSIGPASLGPVTSAWPVPILGVLTSRGGLDVGYWHACAVIRDDGRVQCWGENHLGELGENPDTHDSGPVTVAGTHSAVAVAAGSGFSCALLSDASVQCWGTNAFGQLGDGTLVNSAGAVTVLGLTDAVAISAGYNHACAVTKTGSIRCWGAVGASSLSVPTTVAGF